MTIYLPGFRKELTTSDCPTDLMGSVKIIYTYDTSPTTAEEICFSCPQSKNCPIPAIIALLQDLTGILLGVKKCGKVKRR